MAPPPKSPSGGGAHLKVLIVWVLLIAGFFATMAWTGRSPTVLVRQSVEWLKDSPLGPPVYVLLFLTRSIHFVPAMLLAVISGYCYGIAGGLALTMLSSLLSAALVWRLGRRMAGDSGSETRFATYAERLRTHGFSTVVLMRWLSIPYDPCSYLSGSMGVPFWTFTAGTTVGNLPATTLAAVFGAGIQGQFSGQLPHLPWQFPVGIVALVVLVLLWRRFRR